jgi:hypothetical protein
MNGPESAQVNVFIEANLPANPIRNLSKNDGLYGWGGQQNPEFPASNQSALAGNGASNLAVYVLQIGTAVSNGGSTNAGASILLRYSVPPAQGPVVLIGYGLIQAAFSPYLLGQTISRVYTPPGAPSPNWGDYFKAMANNEYRPVPAPIPATPAELAKAKADSEQKARQERNWSNEVVQSVRMEFLPSGDAVLNRQLKSPRDFGPVQAWTNMRVAAQSLFGRLNNGAMDLGPVFNAWDNPVSTLTSENRSDIAEMVSGIQKLSDRYVNQPEGLYKEILGDALIMATGQFKMAAQAVELQTFATFARGELAAANAERARALQFLDGIQWKGIDHFGAEVSKAFTEAATRRIDGIGDFINDPNPGTLVIGIVSGIGNTALGAAAGIESVLTRPIDTINGVLGGIASNPGRFVGETLYGLAEGVALTQGAAIVRLGVAELDAMLRTGQLTRNSPAARVAVTELRAQLRAPRFAQLAPAEQQRIRGLLHSFQVIQPTCFVAGTPLLTQDGEKPVERFKLGDKILSRAESDPEGPVEVKIVEETFVRVAPIMSLRIRGQEIRTTFEHPFYVKEKGWTLAKEVKPGDQFSSDDGQWVSVEAVTDLKEVTTVYNLRVSDYHTYFVGSLGWGFSVWAHNANYEWFQIGNKFYARNSVTKQIVRNGRGEILELADRAALDAWIAGLESGSTASQASGIVARLHTLDGATLPGGIRIRSVTLADEIEHIAGGTALAQNSIIGNDVIITLASNQSNRQVAISIYHELIEVAIYKTRLNPPAALANLTESGIDALARRYYNTLGVPDVQKLTTMLRELGL